MSVKEWSPTLTTLRACLLVGLAWAGIYLPGLGSVPLKHEEPRRALPAVHMLATGDWLVPWIGANPYLRKPPLLNWLIAVSYQATGGRSEFATRLPSVLATLALALTVVVTGRRWLGAPGTVLAAVFILTNFAVMESGRLAELEALYVSLTGIALMLWLTAWHRGANRWRLWCAPAPFLALGMLTKGPVHLAFFYGVVVAVLLVGQEWKMLFHPAHAVALLVTIGPFIAWAIPCAAVVGSVGHLQGGASGAWAFWFREISSRAAIPAAAHFPLVNWLLRIPQGFVNYLPWTVLLPLLWSPGITASLLAAGGPREVSLFQGARAGMVVTFLVMSLLPGSSPRYVYPLVVVPSVLLARVLMLRESHDAPGFRPVWLPEAWRITNLILYFVIVCAAIAMPFFAAAGSSTKAACVESGGIILLTVATWHWRSNEKAGILPLALKSVAGMMLVTAVYAFAAVPRLNRPRTGLPREIASSIRSHVPGGKNLGILDDGYQAFWYYLEPSVVYFRRLEDIPFAGSTEYFLVPAKWQKACIADAARRGTTVTPIFEASDLEHRAFVLLARQATSASSSTTDNAAGKQVSEDLWRSAGSPPEG